MSKQKPDTPIVTTVGKLREKIVEAVGIALNLHKNSCGNCHSKGICRHDVSVRCPDRLTDHIIATLLAEQGDGEAVEETEPKSMIARFSDGRVVELKLHDDGQVDINCLIYEGAKKVVTYVGFSPEAWEAILYMWNQMQSAQGGTR